MSYRLKVVAWAGARNLLSRMRERRLLRPLAERIIARGRRDGALGAVGSGDEDAQERALLALFRMVQPAEAVPGRIVMVCGSLQPGGAERQLVNTVRALARRGIRDVTVLCAHLARGQPEAYDFFSSELATANAAVREIQHTLPWGSRLPSQLAGAAALLPTSLVCDVADLWRELYSLRPAIVHAWLDWSNIRVGLAAVLCGVPQVLLSGRNLNPSRFFFYEPIMRAAYRALLSQPGVTLINNSAAGAQDYATWLGLPAERIAVIYNGADFPVSDPTAAHAERRRIGVPDAALLVGSIFRFSREKRPLLWLDAAAAILARRPDAKFALYGTGPMLPEVRARAASLGLQKQLILAGLTADPIAALGAMDVFMLTSEAEGTPNTAIEAQWAGRPVVACAAGGIAEAFLPGETGILVPHADPEAIADAVLRVAADHAWRERIRSIGPAFVASRFGIERMIATLIAHYGFADHTGSRCLGGKME